MLIDGQEFLLKIISTYKVYVLSYIRVVIDNYLHEKKFRMHQWLNNVFWSPELSFVQSVLIIQKVN